MNLSEALVITGLGIAVVFSGLILTSLLISSFSFIPRIFESKEKKAGQEPVRNEPSAAAVAVAPDPDVVAVIAAVLEVEFRLRLPLLEGRFTFRS